MNTIVTITIWTCVTYNQSNNGNQKFNGNVSNNDSHGTELSITTTETLLTFVTAATVMLVTQIVMKVCRASCKVSVTFVQC